MAPTRPSAVKPISVTVGNVKHHGTYYVQSGMVYAQSTLGTKVTQLGDLSPETVARMLLSELVTGNSI